MTNEHEQSYLAVQPCSLDSAKEKLRTVGVWSGIGHWEDTWSGVLELEVFVSELVSVNWFTTSTIVVGEISTLNEKLLSVTHWEWVIMMTK